MERENNQPKQAGPPFQRGRLLILLAFIAGAFALTTMYRGKRQYLEHGFSGTAFGSEFHVSFDPRTISRSKLQDIENAFTTRLKELDGIFSNWNPKSEICRLNDHQKPEPLQISKELFTVLECSIATNESSDGAFDPSIAPLIELWGFGVKDKPKTPPTDDEIAELRPRMGMELLRLAPPDRAEKVDPGLSFNLSAVAPGYIVDQCGELLETFGIHNYMIEISGEIRARGINPYGKRWKIGIEKPLSETKPVIEKILYLDTGGLATSGDYRNFWEKDGKRYSHTLDPQTGRPVEHDLASVTVIAPNVMVADAVATTCMVLGYEEAVKWISKLPDTQALFFIRKPDGSFEEKTTKGFEKYLEDKED